MNKLGESFNDGNRILGGIQNIDKFLMRSLMDKSESIPSWRGGYTVRIDFISLSCVCSSVCYFLTFSPIERQEYLVDMNRNQQDKEK